MKENKKLPTCPYCGKKLNYMDAWLLKTSGEYHCGECGNTSEIKLSPLIYKIAVVIVILNLLIVILFLVFNQHGSLWGIIPVALSYLVFYAVVPYFIYLKPSPNHPDYFNKI